MEKSRFKKHLKKKALQNILLAIAGVVFIVVLLFTIGPKLLIGFSILAGKLSSNENVEVTQQTNDYIAPPILESPFEATNSAVIKMKGTAKTNSKVQLYINSIKTTSTITKDNGTFTFSSITLKDGVNKIKVKAVTEDNKESGFSNEVQIVRLNKFPTLEIESPTDGQKFKKAESPIKIKGKTDPSVKVTVNEFWAIVDAQGQYNYNYNLKEGENNVTINATDQAGNTTSKSIKIQVE